MKKVITAVVCVVVIGVAVWRLLPEKAEIQPQMVERPRVCEECGEYFDGPTTVVLQTCPHCGKRAGVRAFFRQCAKCEHVFEAFRERPVDQSITQINDEAPPPETEFKRPGGDWVSSYRALGKLECPKCKSTELRQAPAQRMGKGKE